MRLIVLTTISLALVPSVATAQSWQDWVKTNPTYGAPPVQPAPAAPPSVPAKSAPASMGANKYPPELKTRFVNVCSLRAKEQGVAVSQANAYCGCIVNKLEANYSLKQLQQLSQNYVATGAYEESTIRAVVEPCLAAVQ
jgi:hypothetical protein